MTIGSGLMRSMSIAPRPERASQTTTSPKGRELAEKGAPEPRAQPQNDVAGAIFRSEQV